MISQHWLIFQPAANLFAHIGMSIYFIKIKCFPFDLPGTHTRAIMLATAIKYQLTKRYKFCKK
jgi:hypothetical protein